MQDTDTGGRGTLDEIRDRISAIDARLLGLLAERRQLSQQAARTKAASGLAIRDQQREEDLLVGLVENGRQAGLDAHYVTRLFHTIIDDSLKDQQRYLQSDGATADARPTMQIAFQGDVGSYSHLAIRQHFSAELERLVYLGCNAFADVITAVEEGRADYAMLPIENTTSGGIHEVYDLLLHTRLAIVGEEKLQVDHCLITAPGTGLDRIERIYAHPQAFAQCSQFIDRLGQPRLESLETSAAVQRVKEEADPRVAAIAGEGAARLFGLDVLERDIADQKDNYTRFLIAAREAVAVPAAITCKTSLVIATSQEPGSLVEALLVFRDRGINLSKLESRPVPGNPWEEMFYVDLEGNTTAPEVSRALQDLTRVTRFLKVLGCYPAAGLPVTALSAATLARAGRSQPDASREEEQRPEAEEGTDVTRSLSRRGHKHSDSVVEVKGVRIGGGDFVVCAGPDLVESEEQIMACAREASEHGARILRGGCFGNGRLRDDTRLGADGLKLLHAAGHRFGLPVMTRVTSAEQVSAVVRSADILELDAHSMADAALLEAVGGCHRPVMLVRGPAASLEEWLEAAETILSGGNQQVLLCEGGIRTLESSGRSTLDLAAVPALRQLTHLPVIVALSRADTSPDLLPPLARAARAAGAQGLVLDLHPQPKSHPGHPTALDFSQFSGLMAELYAE